MISITKLLMDVPNFGDTLRYTPHAHKSQNGVGEGRGPVVVWNCTKTCNLNCVHCYARSEAIKYQNELTHEEGLALIDQLADELRPEIARDREKWGGSLERWESMVQDLRDYVTHAGGRAKLMVNSLYNQISLTDAEKQEYFGDVK